MTRLCLDQTDVTDAGLKEVAQLTRTLKLSLWAAHKITDAGLKDLVELKNLTYLNLWGTKATKVGTKEIQKSLPNADVFR